MRTEETRKNLKKNLKNISYNHDSFEKVFITMCKRFISKKNKVRICKLFIASIPILIIFLSINKSDKTYDHGINLVQTSNNLIIPLFGVLFTGYTIFQAFTSGQMIISLLSVNTKEMSQFEEFNINFFEVLIVYLSIIVINYIILVTAPILYDFYIANPEIKLNIKHIFPIIVYIYFFINMYALLEMKSFLFNIYQCFNMYAFINGIKDIQENDMKQAKENEKQTTSQ